MCKTGRSGSGGLTLLEVIISTAVLSVAMVGLVAGLLSAMRLRQLNEEKALARNAAERALSAMRGMPSISDAYDRFGGGGREETFDVYGLASPGGGELVGRVIVWRRKNGNPPDPDSAMTWPPADLLEARQRFGRPFPLTMVGEEGPFGIDYLDTNADGVVDGTDTPSLMPVTVRIRWRSRAGIITEYFSTVIGVR